MINQSLKLAIAAGFGVASLAVTIASPTLTSLTPDDMARFANGERVSVTAYRPNRLLSVALGLGGVGLLSWWGWRELQNAPAVVGVDMPTEQPEPVQGQFVRAPAGVPAPEKYIDISAVLAQRLRPTLITGNPRIGKGIAVAHAIRHIKRAKECPVWLIQPKYHPKEHAYWEPCDRVMGFMLEDYLQPDQDIDTLCQELAQFIFEW